MKYGSSYRQARYGIWRQKVPSIIIQTSNGYTPKKLANAYGTIDLALTKTSEQA